MPTSKNTQESSKNTSLCTPLRHKLNELWFSITSEHLNLKTHVKYYQRQKTLKILLRASKNYLLEVFKNPLT